MNNETKSYHSVYIQNVTDVNETTIYYNITGLCYSLIYTFIIQVMDIFNNIKDQNHIVFCKLIIIGLNILYCLITYSLDTIATYHVQVLTLKYYSDNGSVVVECRFAERSTADGCHVTFRESSKGTVTSINLSKSSIEESTVYRYITLPVSGNYTVTVHDIVGGTIITNPSVVYPQVLEYILLLPSPTETVIITSRYYIVLFVLFYNNLLGTTSILLLPSPTETIIAISKSLLYCLFYNFITTGITSSDKTFITISKIIIV